MYLHMGAVPTRLMLTVLLAVTVAATGHKRERRQVSALVGGSCGESTGCARGAYCDATRRCACLSSFTVYNGYCWRKINPGESGCSLSVQCSAVWPDAYCSFGVCKCANGEPSFNTRDGHVCLSYGFCPVNGEYTKLMNSGGLQRECTAGLDSTCGGDAKGYDCICGSANCDLTASAFCCPSRALACIMDSDSGSAPLSGGNVVSRWFHNPLTGNCQTFAYRGAKGNANNFQTRDQCESYCGNSCTRGVPQYDPFNPPETFKGSIRYCTGDGGCDNRFSCTQIGSRNMCCPKPSYICSVAGGLGNRNVGTANYDPGLADGSASVFLPRWYYDITEKICKPFTYLGQSGNFNNFLSQSHCEAFCAKVVCDAGEPLKDQTGISNLQCSSSTCPETHSCVSEGVCCPRKQHVCSQPKALGTCNSRAERFWYNGETRNCESFSFSGCQGNDNNFASYDDCQTFCRDATTAPKCGQGEGLKDSYGNYVVCGGTSASTITECPANHVCLFDGATHGCCPNREFTCGLAIDAGTSCGPSVNRWAFSSATKRCQSFAYAGCDGNSNNFATQSDCLDYCGVGGCPNGGEPYKEVNGQYRSCSNGIACPNSHFCTQVTLGLTLTYNYCCPSKDYICSLPRDQGIKCGSGTLDRYFFNSVTRSCERFIFNGCDGNRNNFPQLNACLNYCNSAACPTGQIAAANMNEGNRLVSCRLDVGGSCEASYTCAFSALLGQNVCCGSPASPDTCPRGQRPFISEASQAPRQCQANIVGSCPAGFDCWYSVALAQYYCCGNSAVQCPKGGSPYIEDTTNAVRQCTPGVAGACPANYDCQATTLNIGNILSTTGHCCGSNGLCGVGWEAYIVGGRGVACAVKQLSACPSGYSCRSSPGSHEGLSHCCRLKTDPTMVTNVCAAYQEVPYIVSRAPVVCSSNSPSTTCPNPFRCRNYAATNTFYCCQPANIPQGGYTAQCPPGTSVVRPIRYCQPSGGPSSCQPGSFCQYDPTQSRYICCGNPLMQQQNPAGRMRVECALGAAYTVGSGPRQCVLGAVGNCPSGFACDYVARVGGAFCCPTERRISFDLRAREALPEGRTRGCPSGRTLFYAKSNVPLACRGPSDDFAPCPKGYHCLPSTVYPGSFQCCSFDGELTTPENNATSSASGTPANKTKQEQVPDARNDGLIDLSRYSKRSNEPRLK